MKKQNRKIALLLALAVCFVMLFSAFYIAAQADHDCIGEDCPICYQISICENTLKTLGFVAAAAVLSAALIYLCFTFTKQQENTLRQATLITLKVKLSN